MITAGLTVALFTGIPVGTYLGGAYGWRATFWLIAAVGATVAAILAVTAPQIPGSFPAPLAERLAPLRHGPVAQLVGTVFLCGSGGLMFYSYLAPITTTLAGGSYRLRSVILLMVGVVGVGAVFLGGRITDAWGPRPARLTVIGGHAAALLAIAAFAFTGARNVAVFAALVALWSLFAWALNPPMQASILSAAPSAAMTAMALNISGLYLGTGVAAALGGLILNVSRVAYLPLVAGLLVLTALALATGRTIEREPNPQPGHSSVGCPD